LIDNFVSMEKQADIYVAIVEDDPEIRQLYTLLINGSVGFKCKDSFESAEDALQALRPGAVDVILMDVDLPGISGIECTRRLRARDQDVDVLMLTVHEDDSTLFDALCAGASGYLLKEMRPSDVFEAINEARRGGAPMSPRIARRVVRAFHSPVESPLSEREREVLKLLCEGENYKTIADKLFISANTVKAHIKHIYQKLEVNSRAEAVSKAHKDRLV
jgi:DNA-binding NarL/FixJ family response regulator